jgi:hypothetical protein
MVPIYAARVADLRQGTFIVARCMHCRHEAELAVTMLRQRLRLTACVKHLGARFRCTECGRKGAELDTRGALGHFR